MIFDKYCNTAIREFLDIGSLLLRIERSQLRWFGHVSSRMPHERLPKQSLYAKMSGKKPFRRRRTRWLVYIEDLGRNRLKHSSEMQFVLVNREMWRFNLELLPLQHFRKSGRKKESFTGDQAQSYF